MFQELLYISTQKYRLKLVYKFNQRGNKHKKHIIPSPLTNTGAKIGQRKSKISIVIVMVRWISQLMRMLWPLIRKAFIQKLDVFDQLDWSTINSIVDRLSNIHNDMNAFGNCFQGNTQTMCYIFKKTGLKNNLIDKNNY